MIEFKNLVFLDLQKTATTSIVAFLRANVAEQEIRRAAHSSPARGHIKRKFHFLSVREPAAIYRSLFLFGCGRNGGLYSSFAKHGLADLYEPTQDKFHAWLEFMIDPEQTKRLGKRLSGMGLDDLCGPITQRMLLVSVVAPRERFSAMTFDTREALRKEYDRRRLFNHYVRVERLVEDLHAALTAPENKTRFTRPIGDVEDLRARMPNRNASVKVESVQISDVPEDLRARLRDREWLMYDLFGYDASRTGAEPPLRARPTSTLAEFTGDS
jgi:hypothetical protein